MAGRTTGNFAYTFSKNDGNPTSTTYATAARSVINSQKQAYEPIALVHEYSASDMRTATSSAQNEFAPKPSHSKPIADKAAQPLNLIEVFHSGVTALSSSEAAAQSKVACALRCNGVSEAAEVDKALEMRRSWKSTNDSLEARSSSVEAKPIADRTNARFGFLTRQTRTRAAVNKVMGDTKQLQATKAQMQAAVENAQRVFLKPKNAEQAELVDMATMKAGAEKAYGRKAKVANKQTIQMGDVLHPILRTKAKECGAETLFTGHSTSLDDRPRQRAEQKGGLTTAEVAGLASLARTFITHVKPIQHCDFDEVDVSPMTARHCDKLLSSQERAAVIRDVSRILAAVGISNKLCERLPQDKDFLISELADLYRKKGGELKEEVPAWQDEDTTVDDLKKIYKTELLRYINSNKYKNKQDLGNYLADVLFKVCVYNKINLAETRARKSPSDIDALLTIFSQLYKQTFVVDTTKGENSALVYNHILSQIPLGHDLNAIVRSAEQERFQQAQRAEKYLKAFELQGSEEVENSGSTEGLFVKALCEKVNKDTIKISQWMDDAWSDEDGNSDHGLRQHVLTITRQEDGEVIHYQLTIFQKNKETGQLEQVKENVSNQEFFLNAGVVSNTTAIPSTYYQYFSASILDELNKLETVGFGEIYGALQAKAYVRSAVSQNVEQYIADQLQESLSKRQITAVLGTGYDPNIAHVGEVFDDGSRETVMRAMMQANAKLEVTMAGSCGTHQNMHGYDNKGRGGVSIFTNVSLGGDLRGSKKGQGYRESPDGNDPYAVEEKQGYARALANTATAGMYEEAIGARDNVGIYSADSLRVKESKLVSECQGLPVSGIVYSEEEMSWAKDWSKAEGLRKKKEFHQDVSDQDEQWLQQRNIQSARFIHDNEVQKRAKKIQAKANQTPAEKYWLEEREAVIKLQKKSGGEVTTAEANRIKNWYATSVWNPLYSTATELDEAGHEKIRLDEAGKSIITLRSDDSLKTWEKRDLVPLAITLVDEQGRERREFVRYPNDPELVMVPKGLRLVKVILNNQDETTLVDQLAPLEQITPTKRVAVLEKEAQIKAAKEAGLKLSTTDLKQVKQFIFECEADAPLRHNVDVLKREDAEGNVQFIAAQDGEVIGGKTVTDEQGKPVKVTHRFIYNLAQGRDALNLQLDPTAESFAVEEVPIQIRTLKDGLIDMRDGDNPAEPPSNSLTAWEAENGHRVIQAHRYIDVLQQTGDSPDPGKIIFSALGAVEKDKEAVDAKLQQLDLDTSVKENLERKQTALSETKDRLEKIHQSIYTEESLEGKKALLKTELYSFLQQYYSREIFKHNLTDRNKPLVYAYMPVPVTDHRGTRQAKIISTHRVHSQTPLRLELQAANDKTISDTALSIRPGEAPTYYEAGESMTLDNNVNGTQVKFLTAAGQRDREAMKALFFEKSLGAGVIMQTWQGHSDTFTGDLGHTLLKLLGLIACREDKNGNVFFNRREGTPCTTEEIGDPAHVSAESSRHGIHSLLDNARIQQNVREFSQGLKKHEQNAVIRAKKAELLKQTLPNTDEEQILYSLAELELDGAAITQSYREKLTEDGKIKKIPAVLAAEAREDAVTQRNKSDRRIVSTTTSDQQIITGLTDEVVSKTETSLKGHQTQLNSTTTFQAALLQQRAEESEREGEINLLQEANVGAEPVQFATRSIETTGSSKSTPSSVVFPQNQLQRFQEAKGHLLEGVSTLARVLISYDYAKKILLRDYIGSYKGDLTPSIDNAVSALLMDALQGNDVSVRSNKLLDNLKQLQDIPDLSTVGSKIKDLLEQVDAHYAHKQEVASQAAVESTATRSGVQPPPPPLEPKFRPSNNDSAEMGLGWRTIAAPLAFASYIATGVLFFALGIRSFVRAGFQLRRLGRIKNDLAPKQKAEQIMKARAVIYQLDDKVKNGLITLKKGFNISSDPGKERLKKGFLLLTGEINPLLKEIDEALKAKKLPAERKQLLEERQQFLTQIQVLSSKSYTLDFSNKAQRSKVIAEIDALLTMNSLGEKQQQSANQIAAQLEGQQKSIARAERDQKTARYADGVGYTTTGIADTGVGVVKVAGLATGLTTLLSSAFGAVGSAAIALLSFARARQQYKHYVEATKGISASVWRKFSQGRGVDSNYRRRLTDRIHSKAKFHRSNAINWTALGITATGSTVLSGLAIGGIVAAPATLGVSIAVSVLAVLAFSYFAWRARRAMVNAEHGTPMVNHDFIMHEDFGKRSRRLNLTSILLSNESNVLANTRQKFYRSEAASALDNAAQRGAWLGGQWVAPGSLSPDADYGRTIKNALTSEGEAEFAARCELHRGMTQLVQQEESHIRAFEIPLRREDLAVVVKQSLDAAEEVKRLQVLKSQGVITEAQLVQAKAMKNDLDAQMNQLQADLRNAEMRLTKIRQLITDFNHSALSLQEIKQLNPADRNRWQKLCLDFMLAHGLENVFSRKELKQRWKDVPEFYDVEYDTEGHLISARIKSLDEVPEDDKPKYRAEFEKLKSEAMSLFGKFWAESLPMSINLEIEMVVEMGHVTLLAETEKESAEDKKAVPKIMKEVAAKKQERKLKTIESPAQSQSAIKAGVVFHMFTSEV